MERRIQETTDDEAAVVTSDEEVSEDEDEKGASDGWEDANSDDGEGILNPVWFRRVRSLPNLASRRSMLTLALNRGQRGSHQACSLPTRLPSRLPSPRRELIATSSQEEGIMMQTSTPPPIAISVTKTMPESVAYSPDTIRQKMLVAELPELLRRNLLREGQGNSTTANAFLKRDQTTQSGLNLHHGLDGLEDYHSRGW